MFGMFNVQQAPYNRKMKCFPVIMMEGKERSDADKGGKIMLPPSALQYLTELHIQYPMLFKLTNTNRNRETHCGVLEFVAEEGRCYLPYWMMKFLLINEGDYLQVQYVSLPIASFAKFQPQSVDFLEITNPKAVLENALRTFATLTKGDVISINYNEKDYELCILETKPGNAVSIIECDMDVDFAPPVGYEEPTKTYKKEPTKINKHSSQNLLNEDKQQPNVGYRLDGKVKNQAKPSTSASASIDQSSSYSSAGATSQSQNANETAQRGIPYYNYKIGTLRLNQFIEKEKPADTKPPVDEKLNKGQKLKHIGVY